MTGVEVPENPNDSLLSTYKRMICNHFIKERFVSKKRTLS